MYSIISKDIILAHMVVSAVPQKAAAHPAEHSMCEAHAIIL